MKNHHLPVALCVLAAFVMTGTLISLKYRRPVTPTPHIVTTDDSEITTPRDEKPIEVLDPTYPMGTAIRVEGGETEPLVLVLNPVQWFGDGEAAIAMIADGVCTTTGAPELSDCAPGGFYIRDNSMNTISYPLATDLVFTSPYELPTRAHGQADVDYFIDVLRNEEIRKIRGPLLVRLEILRGQVVSIAEQYLP